MKRNSFSKIVGYTYQRYMKKCNIYASAQLFGFGPTALLLSTLDTYEKRYSSSSEITILGSKNLSILLNGKPNGFHILKSKDAEDELFLLYKTKAYKQFDLFVSFFNPAPVLYSWFYNKKCVFHDGLFDFWDIPSFEARLEKDLAYVRECKEKNNFKALVRWYDSTFKSNPHQVIFMAHYFASKNYIRNNSVVDDILSRFPELKNKPLHKVGCIIDPKLDQSQKKQNDYYLVSLGGSIAPVITFDQNVYYAKQVVHLINYMAQRDYYNRSSWFIVCHPQIHKTLDKDIITLAPNVKVISSVGMGDFMKMIREARAIIVPPGYGTVQEACYANKPIFFIPEQNAGQPLYFKTLHDHKFPYQYSLTLTRDLNNGKLIYKEFDIDRMYGDMYRLIYSSECKKIRDQKIDSFKKLLQNKKLLQEHVKRQYQSMQRMPGGFDGALVISHGIQEVVLQLTKEE